jgi:hypothetical protein
LDESDPTASEKVPERIKAIYGGHCYTDEDKSENDHSDVSYDYDEDKSDEDADYDEDSRRTVSSRVVNPFWVEVR